MPQLNPEFYVSQLFWLVVTFLFLLLFLWKISLPRIKDALEKREIKINNHLQNAKLLQEEAEKLQKNIDDRLKKAKINNENLVKNSINNIKKDTGEKINLLDKELESVIEKTSINIEENKKIALRNIKNDIEVIVSLAVNKITGDQMDNKSVTEEISQIDFNSKDLN